MKKLLQCFVFVSVLVAILLWISHVCRDKDSRLEGIFNEPRGAVDIVVVGSSHAYFSWNPLVLYRNTGLTSIVYGSPSQPTWITYEYLKFALEKHRPRFVVFECYALSRADENDHKEGDARRGIDAIPDWKRRLSCIERMYPEDDVESRYFQLAKYHSRWASLRRVDYHVPFYGPNAHGFSLSQKKMEKPFTFRRRDRREGFEISGNAKSWLGRIKDLAESKGARLLVYSAPYNLSDECYERVCQVGDWCKAHGVAFLNCNEWSFVRDLTPSRDYADGGHVNFLGAEIVTSKAGDWLGSVLGQELARHMPLSDNEWNTELGKYEDKFGIKALYNIKVLPMLRTWRVDCQVPSKNGSVGVQGVTAERPPSIQKEGFGVCKITGVSGKQDFVLTCNSDGEAKFRLRGMYAHTPAGTNFPFVVEYTSFKVDDKEMLNGPVIVTYDNDQVIQASVKAGRPIKCHVETRRHVYAESDLNGLLREYCAVIGEKSDRVEALLAGNFLRDYKTSSGPENVKK